MNTKILFNSPDFYQPKPELEQYSTPVDIVAEMIKLANAQGDLSGNVVDLGCGTGRLAIGAALLGTEVTGYEIDNDALELAKNYSKEHNLDIKWVNLAIENIDKKYDTVIMNPPFGSQRPGADRAFLEKSLEIGKRIWSIHMAETKNFVKDFVEKNSGEIITAYEFDFPIKNSMPFHTKNVSNQKAILYHIASLR
ncbi:MAG: METTL5 family protein [Candidatus Poseidoniia archaeon]|nr:METTL5 family protein [Candidatus Poseidoniia archaeon]